MAKKKILFRIGSLTGGGAEKVLITFLNQMDFSNYDVDLLLNIKHGIYLNQLPKEVNLKYISKDYSEKNKLIGLFGKSLNILKEKYFTIYPKQLYSLLLKNKKYDVEIAFIQTLIPEILKSPNPSSIKIGWVHADVVNTTKYSEKLRSNTLKSMALVDYCIFVTDGIRRVFVDYTKKDSKKYLVIYNPLNFNKIRNLSNEFSKINFKNDKINIVTIGRLHEEKGYLIILETIRLLKNNNKIDQFHFYFIGEGGLLAQIKEKINTFCISDYITVIPFQKNPYPLIKNADILLNFSHDEGFSLVVAEAMCLNTPIISSPTNGVLDITNNGKYAIIIERKSESLYNSLSNLNQNELLNFEKPDDDDISFIRYENVIRKFNHFLESL